MSSVASLLNEHVHFRVSSVDRIGVGGYIRDLMTQPVGTAVDAYGWVKTRRDSKGVHFLQLNDGSSFKDLQVVIEAGPYEVAEVDIVVSCTGWRRA